MSVQVGIAAALAAGLVSFLSPCVLPLIPAYLSFMTGLTTAQLAEGGSAWRKILGPSLLFVAGFAVIFVSLGASASVIGQFLQQYRFLIEKVGGLVVVAFGVLMLGVIRVPWLYGEARIDLSKSRSFGRGAAFVMGMAFAAGWTPCVGPMLASILALAGSSGDVGRGALLLLAYSLGLGVPFIAVALLFGRITPVLRWLNRHALVMNRVAGVLLIVVGVLMVSGRLSVLGAWLTNVVPTVEL